jgi:hypothetical protein
MRRNFCFPMNLAGQAVFAGIKVAHTHRERRGCDVDHQTIALRDPDRRMPQIHFYPSRLRPLEPDPRFALRQQEEPVRMILFGDAHEEVCFRRV